MHKSGLELGDRQASGISLDIWARATGGKVPEDILATEANRERTDLQAKAQVLVASGVQLLAAGRYEEGVKAFEQSVAEGRRLGWLNVYCAPSLSWLAAGLRSLVESQPSLTPKTRSRLFRRAEAAARRAVRVGWRLQNDLPHALREHACILALRGHVRRARTAV